MSSAEAAKNAETDELNSISRQIIGGAIALHWEWGPGLLESAHEARLTCELLQKGPAVERQVPLPVVCKGTRIECGCRMDLLIARKVIGEWKALEATDRIHRMRVPSYLRLAGLRLGLLINFNRETLIGGVTRIVNRPWLSDTPRYSRPTR